MIRTEADEVTYGLHIILRYEIEKAIFRDNVKTDDLPALWNQKMQELLGITPANDAEGILQDMHWSDGSFGYFPPTCWAPFMTACILKRSKRISEIWIRFWKTEGSSTSPTG